MRVTNPLGASASTASTAGASSNGLLPVDITIGSVGISQSFRLGSAAGSKLRACDPAGPCRHSDVPDRCASVGTVPAHPVQPPDRHVLLGRRGPGQIPELTCEQAHNGPCLEYRSRIRRNAALIVMAKIPPTRPRSLRDYVSAATPRLPSDFWSLIPISFQFRAVRKC